MNDPVVQCFGCSTAVYASKHKHWPATFHGRCDVCGLRVWIVKVDE